MVEWRPVTKGHRRSPLFRQSSDAQVTMALLSQMRRMQPAAMAVARATTRRYAPTRHTRMASHCVSLTPHMHDGKSRRTAMNYSHATHIPFSIALSPCLACCCCYSQWCPCPVPSREKRALRQQVLGDAAHGACVERYIRQQPPLFLLESARFWVRDATISSHMQTCIYYFSGQ